MSEQAPTDELMAALAGLLDHVGELEALVRTTSRGATAEIDGLRGVVVELAQRVEQLDPPASADQAPSLEHASEPEPRPWVETATRQDWIALAEWVHQLHNTYDLPLKYRVRPCGPAHRGVTEELAALRTAWHAAAQQGDTPGDDLASWHERHLHPCLDRITHRYAIANCEDGHTHPLPVRPTDPLLLDQACADATSGTTSSSEVTMTAQPPDRVHQ
jgi:hypothetical protein